jgi:magnesium chelatase subunit D
LLHFDSAGDFATRVRPAASARTEEIGRRRGRAARRGPGGTPGARNETGATLARAATVRTAALHQTEREVSGPLIQVQREDLRFRPPRGPAGGLLLFVVDASGSMAAWRRMRQTKAALLALLRQAYRQRDRVALLAFRGRAAELVLPPTRGPSAAQRAIEALPVGGATPLAHGLAAAERLLRQQRRRHATLPIWTVVLTDGRANVGIDGDPWRDALDQARRLAACATECLVVDTEMAWPRFGRAAELARRLGADCLPLEDVIGTAALRRRVV